MSKEYWNPLPLVSDETARRFGYSKAEPPPPKPIFDNVFELILHPRKPEWFVKGLIEKGTTVLSFGPSGSGKSFIAVDLAANAATGGEWFGRGIVAPGPVFYLAGEGRGGILRRLQAWQYRNETTIPDGKMFLSSERIPLDERGGDRVADEIADMADIYGIPSLIVIDTVARALPVGADENSARDMGAFVNVVDRIRDRFNCVAYLIHHTGHTDEKRARGSSALKATLDAEMSVLKKGGIRIAEWTKLKDLPDDHAAQEFIIESVIVSALEDEREIVTAGVCVWRGPAPKRLPRGPTAAENLGLETLRAVIKGNGGASATLEAWRPEFYARHTGDNTDAKNKAFQRIRKSLQEKGLVHTFNDRYSITGT